LQIYGVREEELPYCFGIEEEYFPKKGSRACEQCGLEYQCSLEIRRKRNKKAVKPLKCLKKLNIKI